VKKIKEELKIPEPSNEERNNMKNIIYK